MVKLYRKNATLCSAVPPLLLKIKNQSVLCTQIQLAQEAEYPRILNVLKLASDGWSQIFNKMRFCCLLKLLLFLYKNSFCSEYEAQDINYINF